VYEYDEINRPKTVRFKEEEKEEEILLEEYVYDILSDKKTQKTVKKYLKDNETAEYIYRYDYAGREVMRINPDKGTFESHYNDNGTLNSTKDANGGLVFYHYDGLNRVTEKYTLIEDTDRKMYLYSKIEYDKAGNIKAEKTGKKPVPYNMEQVMEPSQEDLIITTYELYKNGKTKTVQSSNGARTEYTYDNDGNIITETVYRSENDKTKESQPKRLGFFLLHARQN